MHRTWYFWAGVLGALGVALGAFGAHGLPDYLSGVGVVESDLDRRLENYETAVRYHMWHTLALLVLAATPVVRSRPGTVAAWLWILGIALFSGCLYAYTVTGVRMLGHIVPIGGMSFIAGWIALAVAAWSTRNDIL